MSGRPTAIGGGYAQRLQIALNRARPCPLRGEADVA